MCLKNTTSEFTALDRYILRVLQVNSVCIWTVAWGGNCNIGNLNGLTVIKLEVSLWAVLYRYARHCHIRTSIKPYSLRTYISLKR